MAYWHTCICGSVMDVKKWYRLSEQLGALTSVFTHVAPLVFLFQKPWSREWYDIPGYLSFVLHIGCPESPTVRSSCQLRTAFWDYLSDKWITYLLKITIFDRFLIDPYLVHVPPFFHGYARLPKGFSPSVFFLIHMASLQRLGRKLQRYGCTIIYIYMYF